MIGAFLISGKKELIMKKDQSYEMVDNGLLTSVSIFLGNNAANPNIWGIIAESPKFKAEYHLESRYPNGICRFGMGLADGSYMPAVLRLPKTEAADFIKRFDVKSKEQNLQEKLLSAKQKADSQNQDKHMDQKRSEHKTR